MPWFIYKENILLPLAKILSMNHIVVNGTVHPKMFNFNVVKADLTDLTDLTQYRHYYSKNLAIVNVSFGT